MITITIVRRILATFFATLALFPTLFLPGFSSIRRLDDPLHIQLKFLIHFDFELAEQDVYIERDRGSGQVFRITRGDHDKKAELFATTSENPRDPFNPAALGPFRKVLSLGILLGEWLDQSGSGVYTCENGDGNLDLTFANLVPKGVYSLWHSFMPLPPSVPYSGTLDLPLGARDGSETTFSADGDGNASFVQTFHPCLQMSDTWITSMLVVSYHSDGETHGGSPGDFGYNAHSPLFLMLPLRHRIK